jgi:predicted Zn finger-like uncharacterized protein
MLIVCPTCATSYTIEPASLGPAGRNVRCARCKESWFATAQTGPVADFVADVIAEAEARDAPPGHDAPPTPVAADDFGHEPAQPAAHFPEPAFAETAPEEHALAPLDAPTLVPPMEEPPPADAGRDDIETFAARRARMHVRRKHKRRSTKWLAIILVLFGFNVAMIGARSEIVRFFPQTASLFQLIGLEVNLRHLTFEGVKISREENDGVSVLAVEGTIVSQSNNPVEVPRLRFAVRNATGQEIYAWTSRPSRSILEPKQKLPFRSRLASPPADASDVLVRFANANDATAEK